MSGAVLILRPEPGATEMKTALLQAGVACEAAAVLEIRPILETPALRDTIQRLAEQDAIVFTSRPAVEHGMGWIDRFWPQLPVAPAWYAVGERTARDLARWGVKASVPPQEETSEGLLGLESLRSAQRVLIVRGQGGREHLPERLREGGARVEVMEVYERVPVARSLPEFPAAVVVTSVDVLHAAVDCGAMRFVNVPLLVPSTRVAQHATSLGFSSVHVAGGAGAQKILETLARLGWQVGDAV